MRAELSLLAGDVVLYRAVFAVSDDRLRGDRGISLMLINQLHQFMSLVCPCYSVLFGQHAVVQKSRSASAASRRLLA